MYPSFSLWRNAFSDLGKTTTSPVAPIFNVGLALGGYMLALAARAITNYLPQRLALYTTCFLLICVAVINENYGPLHFYVSIAFFTALAIFTGIEATRGRSILLWLGLSTAVSIWITHFAYSIPPGAAIPEAVSICVGYAAIARSIARTITTYKH